MDGLATPAFILQRWELGMDQINVSTRRINGANTSVRDQRDSCANQANK